MVNNTPEVQPSAEVLRWISRQCGSADTLERLETTVTSGAVNDAFLRSNDWLLFRAELKALYEAYDHVVVRGLPADGTSLIFTVMAIAPYFRTYRGGRIVKHFRMSPWTNDLSHTASDGHFHTDLNTADRPPDVTAMQCLKPDPAGDGHGNLRVARLSDLLAQLRNARDELALSYLEETEVEMASDVDTGIWRGPIVRDNTIRYHPVTIRTAAARNRMRCDVDEGILSRVQDAALAVSRDITLRAGDALIVSNRKALHYRSACTVRFLQFPRAYESREVYVLHASEAH